MLTLAPWAAIRWSWLSSTASIGPRSLAAIAGQTIAKRALRPVEDMTERATHITATNLHDRLVIAPEQILDKAHLRPVRAAVFQADGDMLPRILFRQGGAVAGNDLQNEELEESLSNGGEFFFGRHVSAGSAVQATLY